MGSGFELRSIDVRGYAVPVQVGGSGPPLILLHGAGGAGLVGPFEQALARDFRVYAPVHPGFGGTPLADWVQGVDDVALHYVDVIAALGLERPSVVGVSLGGWIATELAVFRPDLLARLVLVSAVGVRPDEPMPDLFILEPGEAMALLFANPSVAAVLRQAASAPDPELIVRMYEEQAAVARLMWKRPYNPRLARRLHHVSCPTLVVWGDQDRLLPPKHGEKLAGLLPAARFRLIRGAGHVVPLEAAEELAREIFDFAHST